MTARDTRVDARGCGTAIADRYRALGGGATLPPFDRGRWSDGARGEAIAFWRERMRAEHRSVPVFAALSAQLYEAGAPLDEVAVLLRLAQDELRHTEICAHAVAALGGEAAFEADLTIAPLARHDGCSIAERALRNVVYASCLSEGIALARLVDALEQTTDETLRAATRAVLADEVDHGTFGFHYLARVGPDLDAATRGSIATYLRHAFAVLERELAAPLVHARRPSDEARRLGVIDPARAREIFYQTIEHAIVPALERHGLDAAASWRARRLLA